MNEEKSQSPFRFKRDRIFRPEALHIPPSDEKPKDKPVHLGTVQPAEGARMQKVTDVRQNL
jgi:hypothetical protein